MMDPFGRLLILICLWGIMRFLFDQERDRKMTERALRGTDDKHHKYRPDQVDIKCKDLERLLLSWHRMFPYGDYMDLDCDFLRQEQSPITVT